MGRPQGVPLRERHCGNYAAAPCIAAALIIGVLCGGAGAGGDGDRECARGDELRRVGSVRAALAAYKDCVALGGGSAATRHNIGVALMDEGAFEESRGYLLRALALQPLLAASYAGIGQAFEAEDRCTEAVPFHQRAVSVARELGQDADQFRGLLLGALLRCPAALDEASPSEPGRREVSRSSASDALADAVPSLANLDSWQLWLKLGTIALQSQRCSEAISAFRTCIRLGGAGSRGESDDCHFGAAICASQNMQHVTSATLFEGASLRRSSGRRALALMGAFLQHAKAFSWGEAGHESLAHQERRHRLLEVHV